MTVSRAINNHPAINSETRKRVLAVAHRLKYQPNQHARALVTNRSYLLGMIVPDLIHSYYAEILRGIESVVRSAGYQILIGNTDEDAAKEITEVEALRHRTDGLIIASALPPDKTREYRKMLRDGLKLVLIDRQLKNLSCPAVTTNNVQVGRLATEHLISMGVYALSRDHIRQHLRPGEPLDMPQLLQGLIDAGEFVNTYQANCKWFDIGNPADYARAQALITSSDDTQL